MVFSRRPLPHIIYRRPRSLTAPLHFYSMKEALQVPQLWRARTDIQRLIASHCYQVFKAFSNLNCFQAIKNLRHRSALKPPSFILHRLEWLPLPMEDRSHIKSNPSQKQMPRCVLLCRRTRSCR